MSLRIRSGCSRASSWREKSPDKTATVLAPAAFPALTSITESPTIMQSHMLTSRALTVFISASDEGLGLCVSSAVTMWLKYFVMLNCSSSVVIWVLGTKRIVINASFIFWDSSSSVACTFGKGLVFAFVTE